MIPEALSFFANHVWQSTLFAGAAALLALALRDNRAAIRYWLWMAASVKFLIPLALLMAIGGHIESRREPSSVPFVLPMADQISQPFPSYTPPPGFTGAPHQASPLPAMLLAIWAAGFIAVSSGWWIKWRRVRSAVGAGTSLPLDVGIPVVSSRALMEPGVFGILRPVLLVPEGILLRLTPAHLAAVVAHELCHVRRRDNLWAALHMLIESIFWFHPMVWLIGVRLIEERECACDEEVLRMGSEPSVYAQSILKVCEFYLESPVACVAGVTGANLKRRIERIVRRGGARGLNAARKLLLAGAGLLAVAIPLVLGMMNATSIRAQSGSRAESRFEVVSIRPCRSGDDSEFKAGPGLSPGRLNVGCETLTQLIERAYVTFEDGRFHATRRGLPIEGGPAWANADQYEINAKAESSVSQSSMNGAMLAAILEEQFRLKLRRRTKEIPVYALTVARGGLKLQPASPGSCTPFEYGMPLETPAPGKELSLCGGGWLRPSGTLVSFDPRGMSMTQFAEWLQLDRPVIDKTGIAGLFDFHLQFALDDTTRSLFPQGSPEAAPSDDPPGGPSIFAALEKQLGLKLTPTKGPGEFLVIDHVEKPTGN